MREAILCLLRRQKPSYWLTMETTILSCFRDSVSPPEARAVLSEVVEVTLMMYGKDSSHSWRLLGSPRWSLAVSCGPHGGSLRLNQQNPLGLKTSYIAPSQLAAHIPRWHVSTDPPCTQQQPVLFIYRHFWRS